jgi:organic radical activating enzyme
MRARHAPALDIQLTATQLQRASSERAVAAPVLEVFASIQGEGRYAGEPQVFLRLAGCPLRCRWCDTPASWTLGGQRAQEGWCTPFQAATRIAEVEGEHQRTVSVTGGEPLMWPEFIGELRTFMGVRRIHLETAGAHPAALASVLDAVDHVSLDLKLPADLGAPVPLGLPGREADPVTASDVAAARVSCLRLVRGRDACGKLIVSGDREPRDYVPILDDVASHAPELMLFLQPVTPIAGVPAPDRRQLEALVELALERSLEVRVVPQIHRMLRLP